MTPLRIAIFAHEFPALSETFVLRHITSLIERGHEVTVLSTAPRAESARHPAIERFDLPRRTPLAASRPPPITDAQRSAGCMFRNLVFAVKFIVFSFFAH